MEHQGQDDHQIFPELPEREVRIQPGDQGWRETRLAVIMSIATKIGCVQKTRNKWARQTVGDGATLVSHCKWANPARSPPLAAWLDSSGYALAETIRGCFMAALPTKKSACLPSFE